MSIEVSKHLLIFIMYKMKTYDKSIEVLSIGEMQKISGGEKWKTHWSGTSNELIYFAEAVANGIALIHNLIFD